MMLKNAKQSNAVCVNKVSTEYTPPPGIGLQDKSLGNKGARLLMSNMDMPPPAKSSMQRTSKIVSKTVKDLNDRDMVQKIEML